MSFCEVLSVQLRLLVLLTGGVWCVSINQGGTSGALSGGDEVTLPYRSVPGGFQ